jgi:hypothetical protein
VLVASAAAVIGVAGDVHAMIELAQAAWSR